MIRIQHVWLGLRAIALAIWLTTFSFHGKAGLLAQEVRDVAIDSDQVMSLAFSQDGSFLAGGGMEKKVRLWDPDTSQLLRTLAGPRQTIRAVDFSPDSTWVAAGSDDHLIYIWNATTGKLERTLQGHQGMVNSVVFSPDGKSLASGGIYSPAGTNVRMACEVHLWDLTMGTKKRTIIQQTGFVDGLTFSPDGKVLAATLASQTAEKTFAGIKLWDPETGEEKGSLITENALPHSVAFSPDGKFLAHGGGTSKLMDGVKRPVPQARLWDVSTGRQVREFTGTGTDYFRSVKFSPDGNCLATGSSGPTKEFLDARGRGSKVVSETQLWEVATGELIWKAEGDLGDVNSVVFSPNGETIATCDHETVKVISAETGEHRETMMTRTLKPFPK